jgi:hypothetical protein
LDVHPPDSGHWSYTEKSVQSERNRNTKFFIWRAFGELQKGCCGEYNDRQAIVGYFDQQLAAQDWQRAGKPFNACGLYLPESEGVKHESQDFVAYERTNSIALRTVPTVCLGVWPSASDTAGFRLVLITVNPSPLSVLDELLG